MNVVVLASGVNRIPLFDGDTPGYKALLPVAGRPSIAHVLDALEASGRVDRLCIVGPRAALEDALSGRPDHDLLESEPGGETFLDSLSIGLRHFASSPQVLVATADLPLLTADAVRDFLAACAQKSSPYAQRLYVSAAPKGCFTGPYAGFTKPFNGYRDVQLCHGNLFLADPSLLGNAAASRRLNRLYAGRKSALHSTLALGLGVALAYMIGVELLHLLTLQQMADIVSRRFGFGIVPVLIDHPEIALDIDEADDYALVRRIAEARGACG